MITESYFIYALATVFGLAVAVVVVAAAAGYYLIGLIAFEAVTDWRNKTPARHKHLLLPVPPSELPPNVHASQERDRAQREEVDSGLIVDHPAGRKVPPEAIPVDNLADSPKSACVVIDGVLDHIITSTMTCVEIVTLLKRHGCVDLTPNLDESATSKIPLAQGGLGDVFRGRFHDGTPIAIKTIRAYGGQSTCVYQKRAAREVYVWSKCKHPNVVRMIGLAVVNGSLAMISRWEAHGNMSYYLSRNPSVDRCQLNIGVCAGLTYLHDNNIVHGDLRGGNVLIDQDGIPMLTDFGNASLMNATLGFTQTQGGTQYTIRWAAPEILNGGTHTTASDVYSLGMTILETLTSAVPFDNLNSDNAVMWNVMFHKAIPTRPEATISKNSIYGDELWDILTKCWSYDPTERPSAEVVWDTLKPLTPSKLMEIKDRAKRKKID